MHLTNTISRIIQHWPGRIRVSYQLTRIFHSKIHSRRLYPDRSSSFAMSTYSVSATTSSYRGTSKTTSCVQYLKTHILLAAYDQRRLSHDCQMRELRTKQRQYRHEKSLQLFPVSAPLDFIVVEIVKPLPKNKPKQSIHRRSDRLIFPTKTSCPHVQTIFYAHGKHLRLSLTCLVWHRHISFEG